jgi:small-conductance mechanosensitive channel
MARSRSRTNVEPIDDFDVSTTPIHEKAKIYQPPEHPATKVASFFKKVHNSSWLIRYFIYITPLTLILLIPLLLGAITYRDSTVGGVRLLWFSIWLEIVWLTLWAGRILAKCIPYPLGLIASLFTNNDKKWRDLGKQLEVPATLFFWWLAIEISFLPTMTNHHWDGNTGVQSWEDTMNKIIVSVFVGCVLNFAEKIIIQLIAISFHTRTYSDRIDINKFQIGSLVKLYSFSKQKIAMEDSEFEANDQGAKSGARTPMQYVTKAGKNARHVLARVGDVAGKVAGDFTGRQVAQSTHPQQVILSLLSTTSGSQVLARRLYRTFVPEGAEVVSPDDLRAAFDNDDEADSAFSMFDKDLNGDISMDELEAVCVEIGRERKAITASLKDLDSVVSKLDDVFVFIVLVITTLVFISLISTSASGVLTSAGSAVLALSWLFSATAQEFLQSIVFVFVKHPFDVGDRVTVYGNSGAMGMGDDYFVKEISLLFTEFKKMEGHVVQAPNSYLNTLFILNQRRSGALAEGVPIVIKFGTTLEQIDALRSRLLEFVTSENREYQKNILTELRNVSEAYSITLNVVFFYKSNWQNELLRLQRRNKFICALMVIMQDLGIEGPRQLLAGQSENMPFHHAAPIPPYLSQPTQKEGTGPQTVPLAREDRASAEHPGSPAPPQAHAPSTTLFVGGRRRGESISQMGKRIDFSLGMSAISSGAEMSDVYDKPRPRLPSITHTSPSPGPTRNRGGDAADDGRSLGLTTSRESKLGRVSSDASSRTHRNRFFGRGRSRFSTMEEGVTLHDLEAGPGRGMMPGIPESSGSPSGTTAATSRRNMENEHSMTGIRRIDPRTGIVSPQAVQRDSAIGRGELPRAVTEPFR